MYARTEYLNSDDCSKQCLARDNTGLDWNYAIARTIDRDLHERLLNMTSEQMLKFASILPLISSGYFDTAKQLVIAAEVDESLTELKQWLIDTLTEADET